MKKSLFLMAMVSVALASCVSDEVVNVAQKNESMKIAFDSPLLYDNAESRANFSGQIGSHVYNGKTYSYPQEEDFLIYAVSHTGEFAGWADPNNTIFFNGIPVEYEGEKFDAWVPIKTDGGYYYWPDNKKLTYAATSPAEINSSAVRTYGSTGLTINGFQVESNPRAHYDLMFAERVANKTAADMDVLDPNKYSGLPVTFHHALSCVKFAIFKDNDVQSEIKLTELSVHGLYDTGIFNEGITENSSDYDQYNYHTGTSKNVIPTWTINTAKEKVNYTSFKGSVVFEWTARAIDALMTGNITDNNYYAPLLVMPQPLDNNVKLIVKYLVGTEDKTKEVQLNTYPKDSPITQWEIGKRYTYVLHYSLHAAKQDIIFFAPSTHDWISDETIEIIL